METSSDPPHFSASLPLGKQQRPISCREKNIYLARPLRCTRENKNILFSLPFCWWVIQPQKATRACAPPTRTHFSISFSISHVSFAGCIAVFRLHLTVDVFHRRSIFCIILDYANFTAQSLIQAPCWLPNCLGKQRSQ